MSPSVNRRVYKHAPIEEALCEFRFANTEWDWTIPGKLQGHLTEYSGKASNRNVYEAKVDLTKAEKSPMLEMTESLATVRLPTSDGRRLVSVGPGQLSIHMLKPYSDWEQFRPKIEGALSAYFEITGPAPIVRVGVRYINRITVAEQAPDLSKYFECSPGTIRGVDAKVDAFLSRTEYAYDSETRLISTFATIDAPAGSTAYLLDLDVLWQGTEPRPRNTVMELVDTLRTLEREAFESAITDRLREAFDAD